MKTIDTTSLSEENILEETVGTLKAGGLVVYPSDTVYGLLVDATNGKAVEKLLAFKNRPRGKAISVFVDWNILKETVNIEKTLLEKLQELLPGPFTIVLPSKHKVSPLLESEDETLGVRIPDSPLVNKLIAQYKKPITATSANLAGRSPHYSVTSLLNTLSSKKKSLIDLVVDGGVLKKRKPSTVVDFTKSEIKILRQGDGNISESENYISNSESSTRKIAREFIKKLIDQKHGKPVAVIIKGDLGAGKTVFVKGIGEQLEVKNIISPTFVIEYEYELKNKLFKKLIHLDLYNIDSPDEFLHLGIERYMEDKNLLCFEWGEKAGEIAHLLEKSQVIAVSLVHVEENTRKISITY